MYQPTDNYFSTLHGLVLSGNTTESKEEVRISPEARNALSGLEALEQACPDKRPSEGIAGKVRYLVEYYTGVLHEERRKIDPDGKGQVSTQARAALKELRYKGNWKFASYIEPVKADLPEVLEALKSDMRSNLIETTGTIDEKELVVIRNQVQRCLKLAKVGAKTEHQMAKQINTANAKMMTVLKDTLQCANLSNEDRQLLGNAMQRINERIIVAARTNGADFKSCDSAGIDLEVQLQRAESKCSEGDDNSEDDY